MTDTEKQGIKKIIRNLKINRITFLIAGLCFMFLGYWSAICLGISIVLLFSAAATHFRYRKMKEQFKEL